MFKRSSIPTLVLLAAGLLVGPKGTERGLLVAQADAEQPAQAPKKNPDRDAFFGEMHIHTGWSVDAYAFGAHAASAPRHTPSRSAGRRW